MAPPRGLLTPRSLKVCWSRNRRFLTDLHHILDARSCINFLWFPHTPKPPRPLKLLKYFNSIFTSVQLLLVWFTFWGPFGLWLHVPCRCHSACIMFNLWNSCQGSANSVGNLQLALLDSAVPRRGWNALSAYHMGVCKQSKFKYTYIREGFLYVTRSILLLVLKCTGRTCNAHWVIGGDVVASSWYVYIYVLIHLSICMFSYIVFKVYLLAAFVNIHESHPPKHYF